MLDMHTHAWDHTPGTPVPTYDHLARHCEAAAAAGITQVAITEHAYRFERLARDVLPHWERARVGPLAEATDHAIAVEQGGDLDAYVEALVDAQDRGLPLLVGLEVDYFPGANEAMAEVVNDYPFDVVLGSVHWLDAWLFDAYDNATFLEPWETRDLDEIWGSYVDALLDLIGAGHVDVLAHLDVIKVAGHAPADPMQHFHRLINPILAADLAVEISTAGLHKPCAEFYPGPSLFDALQAAGVAFTTASDGHVPDTVGRNYDKLRVELTNRNIAELRTFRRRQPMAYPIGN
jgi:histidinol-phosphatase (PHP family)